MVVTPVSSSAQYLNNEKELRDLLSEIKSFVEGLNDLENVQMVEEEELEKWARRYGRITVFNNVNFCTNVRNRSAPLTVYIGSERVLQRSLNERQRKIIEEAPQTLEKVFRYLEKAPIVYVKRRMCDNPEFTPNCHFYLSVYKEEHVRLAYMFSKLLFRGEGAGPEMYLIDVPEWLEIHRQILVFPEIGVTFVLGSDYFGEVKKGFLRMAMWFAKQRGMLGLHAGAKIARVRGKDGRLRKYGVLIFGLTATGKTTHTCHNHGLEGDGEGCEIMQDDVVFLKEDGSALGPERSFFVKTDSLTPETQPILYAAATSPDAILENVMVDYKGEVHFHDETLTGNGRGIILREHLGSYATKSVNLPPASELDGLVFLFITRRNTVLPIASKLTMEQGAAAFMLGESIESSGGDPRRAGESVRVVGTNPFIVGDETEEGNIFYEILRKNRDKVQCYLLNTGGVGEILETLEDGRKVVKQKVLRVEIPEMAAIIRGILRGTIEWRKDDYFNVLVPSKVEGVDMSKFDLKKFYTEQQIKEYVKKLRKEREEYIKQFIGLHEDIVKAAITM